MSKARRLAITFLLAGTISLVGVSYGVAPAYAFTGPNPALDPINADQLETMFRTGSVWTPADPTYPLPKVDDAVPEFLKIAQDFGVEPAVSITSWPTTLTLGAGALYLGWKIPHVLGISDYFYGLFGGSKAATALEGSGPLQGRVTQIVPGTVFTVGNGFWVNESICGTGTGATCPATVNSGAVWWTNCTGTATACSSAITGTGGLTQTEYSRWGGAHVYVVHETTTGLCGGTGTVTCDENFAGWTEADASTDYHPTYAGNFANIPAGLPTTEVSPSQTFPSAGNATIQSQARTDTGSANCQVQTYLGKQIDPAWSGDGSTCNTPSTTLIPIYLPQPLPGETVQEYAQRLRADQYLGAITVVDDPMGYPTGTPALALQPDTLTRVRVGVSTTVPIYDPLTGQPSPFPTNAPQIQSQSTSTNIELQEVPPTYTPVPVPGGGGGLHMPTISFACQFPFGFICWAQDVTGWFNVSPQAPDFNFTIPDQTVGGHTYHVGSHYDVNLNIMDAYMTIFRGIISVVLWIGGIYFLAVKLLGFHPGGDPGEAIDDGLDMDGM